MGWRAPVWPRSFPRPSVWRRRGNPRCWAGSPGRSPTRHGPSITSSCAAACARSTPGSTFWSPNVNIFRDPRWGRGQETYGEDPYLTGRMGVAFVKGLQGDDPRYLKLVATPKHFAVHSGPEPDRHHFDAAGNGARSTGDVPAGVRGLREGRGRRLGDGRVQPHQRRALLRQPDAAGTDPAPGMGLRRLCGLRLLGDQRSIWRARRCGDAGRGRGIGCERRLRSGVRLRVCSVDGCGRSGPDRPSDPRSLPGAVVHGADAPGHV